jgi:hypothetical protein
MTAAADAAHQSTAKAAAAHSAASSATAAGQLRLAIIGLLSFAAAEEELLLAGASQDSQPTGAGPAGSPRRWAAVPVIAHNTEFKQQQVLRLAAISCGQQPPEFTEIDHRAAATYRRYAQPADQAASRSHQITRALLDAVSGTSDADLLDPARHAWLRGRQLGLQIIVRGFWHPTGHIADYYLQHGKAGRAVALQEHAVATAGYVGSPPAAIGMAYYSLACVLAMSGLTSAAADALRQAIALNADLRDKAARDPDLAALRAAGLAS